MRRVRNLTVTLCVLALTVATPALAADVNLDPTFSGDGKVVVSSDGSTVLSLARSSGDVFFAGEQPAVGAKDRRVPFVGRLEDNGVLDATFSADGVRALPASKGRFWITGLTVDGLGRAVLVAQSGSRIVVARFTTTGGLDATFSGDGTREFSGGASIADLFPRVAIDSQGRLIVAAMVEGNREGHSDVVVRRLLASGTLDDGWSRDGVKVIDNADADWIEGLTTDDRDRVLLGSDNGGTSPAVVYRFRRNGQPDDSFSDDGVAQFRFAPRQNAFSLGIGVNGANKITVAGAACCNSGGTSYGAVRFLPNGERDTSYGDRGMLGLSCLSCFPTWGDVNGGRVAIVIDPYQNSGLTRVVRISASGTTIRHESVDIYPSTTSEQVFPVEIEGARTLLGGGQRKRGAFVARVP